MLRLRSLAVGLILVGFGVQLSAQEPKLGSDWHEDAVDVGFRIKKPRGWAYVPGSPLEPNLIGKYAPEKGGDVNLGHDAIVQPKVYLVKFDRRKKTAEKRNIGGEEVELSVEGAKDIEAWMSKGIDEGKAWRPSKETLKNVKGALEARALLYEGESTLFMSSDDDKPPPPQPIRAYAALFSLRPEIDIAVVGLGPGDPKKWRTFENAYTAIAKTLQPLALAGKPADAAPIGKDPRSQKRAKLEQEIARSPGWSLSETPNYFVLTNNPDKAFIEDLKVRLEAIRLVYEKDYPPNLARKIQIKPKPEEGAPEGRGDESQPDPNRTVSAIDALELGKCSVVRVCLNQDQYQQYGGPPSSSGYFNSLEEELLVYDDKEHEGRDATWGTMYHEGFHQYIFSFFGNIDPHSWYNEGTGDYYSGFDFNLKTRKFTPKEEKGRKDNLLLIRNSYAPLKDFVQWTQAQYYGGNSGNGHGGEKLEGWACYAEGWSLVWFLRTGESNKAKGWQKSWGTILDTYLETLLETGETDQAVEKAFQGVDWDALEKSWFEYMT